MAVLQTRRSHLARGLIRLKSAWYDLGAIPDRTCRMQRPEQEESIDYGEREGPEAEISLREHC